MNEKPLITVALFAFNQEKYIRNAIEGVFSQTYSPLQIILSDDCSTDQTYKIMKEMAEGYAGVHRLTLRCSPQNLGLAQHINDLVKISEGDIIVPAAGDDISYPNRVDEIVKFYFDNNQPLLIFSDCDEIDSNGRNWNGLKIIQAEKTFEMQIESPGIRGATCVWHKRLFTEYPLLSSWLTAEDFVLPIRSYLLNSQPKYLSKKLLQYRRNIISQPIRMEVRFFWQLWPTYSSFRQLMIDIKNRNDLDLEKKLLIREMYLYYDGIFKYYSGEMGFLFAIRNLSLSILIKVMVMRFRSLPGRPMMLLNSINKSSIF